MNGVGVAVGASLVAPSSILGEILHVAEADSAPEKQAGYNPPAKTGMRGSHDGSWETGHALRDGKKWEHATKDKGPTLWNLALGPSIWGVEDGPTVNAATP